MDLKSDDQNHLLKNDKNINILVILIKYHINLQIFTEFMLNFRQLKKILLIF